MDLCTVSVAQPLVIDSSPPTPGHVSVSFLNFLKNTTNDVLVEWSGFTDPESGVEYFYLGVGSTPHNQETMVFTPVTASSHILNIKDTQLEDGKLYYFLIKVDIP